MFPVLTSNPQPSGLSLLSIRVADTDATTSQVAFLLSRDFAHSERSVGKTG